MPAESRVDARVYVLLRAVPRGYAPAREVTMCVMRLYATVEWLSRDDVQVQGPRVRAERAQKTAKGGLQTNAYVRGRGVKGMREVCLNRLLRRRRESGRKCARATPVIAPACCPQ